MIAMLLKMIPEKCLQSNDNAINAIAELRNAADRTQKRVSDLASLIFSGIDV